MQVRKGIVTKRNRLKAKIRSKISGTSKRPRFTVYKSNTSMSAQLIDDVKGKTLVSATDMKISKGTKTEKAKEIGKVIAEKAKEAKISEVVFDRNGFNYTGRVKVLADSARDAGLKF